MNKCLSFLKEDSILTLNSLDNNRAHKDMEIKNNYNCSSGINLLRNRHNYEFLEPCLQFILLYSLFILFQFVKLIFKIMIKPSLSVMNSFGFYDVFIFS